MLTFKIAFRFIFSKKYKWMPSALSIISFAGVFLSVMTLITVMSVMNGFRDDFIKTIIGVRAHVTLYPVENSRFDFAKIKPEIALKIPNHQSIEEMADGEGVLNFNGKTRGILAKGIHGSYFQSKKTLENAIEIGSFNSTGIVIGKALADELGIKIGDKLTFISSHMRETIFGLAPIHKDYIVSGIFSIKMHYYDSSLVFLPFDEAKKLFELKSPSAIEITLNDGMDAEMVSENLNLSFPAYITNWRNDNAGFLNAINIQTNVMFFILFLFILISSFIILACLLMLVNEKKPGIAMLSSFGMGHRQIVAIFILTGAFIVIPAILLGASAGIAFSLNVENIKNSLESLFGMQIFDGAYYFLSYLPSHVQTDSVVKIIILSLSLSFIAVCIPAFKAAKQNPIDILKWE